MPCSCSSTHGVPGSFGNCVANCSSSVAFLAGSFSCMICWSSLPSGFSELTSSILWRWPDAVKAMAIRSTSVRIASLPDSTEYYHETACRVEQASWPVLPSQKFAETDSIKFGADFNGRDEIVVQDAAAYQKLLDVSCLVRSQIPRLLTLRAAMGATSQACALDDQVPRELLSDNPLFDPLPTCGDLSTGNRRRWMES